MHLESQLKRGYLALIGMILLGLCIVADRGALKNEVISDSSALTANTCKIHIKSNWKLASTPIDIEPILIRKALICRA